MRKSLASSSATARKGSAGQEDEWGRIHASIKVGHLAVDSEK